MSFLRLWKKASRGRRLKIKRIALFPVIIYAAYILIDSFMPLFMIGFIIWLLYSWIENRRY